MPVINRPPKRQATTERNENTEERLLRKQLYNTTKWRKARLYHIKTQPLCQECLKEGKVYGGTLEDPIQVHHIVSPFKNGKINWELALDDSNLMTICSYHHGLHHAAEKGWEDPKKVLAVLEELFKEVEDDDKGDSGQTL